MKFIKKITFIAGNGLNLFSGIDATYPEFKSYCHERQDDECFKRVHQLISSNKFVHPGSPLQWQMIRLWSEFETALAQWTYSFSVSDINKYIKLLECISSCSKELLDTKSASAPPLERNLIHRFFGLISCVLSEYKDYLPKSILWTARFVSFTHTDILSSYVRRYKRLHWTDNRAVHINPKVIVYAPSRFIWGVSRETEIACPILNTPQTNTRKATYALRNLSDSLIKGQADKSYFGRIRDEFEKQIESSDVVCIFGMSIGNSDRVWWDFIFRWLNADLRHILIIFCHDVNKVSIIEDTFMAFAKAWTEQAPGPVIQYKNTSGWEVIRKQFFVRAL